MCRLRTGITDTVLQQQASRARNIRGYRLGLEDFAQYLDLPVTDMLTELHSLFNQVGI